MSCLERWGCTGPSIGLISSSLVAVIVKWFPFNVCCFSISFGLSLIDQPLLGINERYLLYFDLIQQQDGLGVAVWQARTAKSKVVRNVDCE
jgi:hypothetical protein